MHYKKAFGTVREEIVYMHNIAIGFWITMKQTRLIIVYLNVT
jgi:hypothetical protein